jgi:hypothetical protein
MLNKNKYTLLFHQGNKLINYAIVDMQNSLKTSLNIDTQKFFNGVNTVTVFKENQPILERKFFIEKPNTYGFISLKKIKPYTDSTSYKINTSIKSNLSVSILSYNNEYNEKRNIKSAFLLNPYTNGNIENSANYFNEHNPKRFEQLDLLLLNQGWAQYSLKEMIQKLNPKKIFEFETGFDLAGKVKYLPANNLILLTNDNKLIDKLFLNGQNNFVFKELLIYKGDSIKIAFSNNRDGPIKPDYISIDTENKPFFNQTGLKRPWLNNVDVIDSTLWSGFFEKNSTLLKEVTIKVKKKSKSLLEKQQLVKKYKSLVRDIGFYYPLDLPLKYRQKNYRLIDYLRSEEGAQLYFWKGLEWYLKINQKYEVFLFVDGKRLQHEQLLGLPLKMTDIENIMVQPLGGSRIYQVFTKPNYKNNTKELFEKFIVEKGYDKPKKYYTPLHYNFEKQNDNFIEEIDWKPSVLTNKNGEATIKIKENKTNDSYTFFIHGFSNQGVLFDKIIRLDN